MQPLLCQPLHLWWSSMARPSCYREREFHMTSGQTFQVLLATLVGALLAMAGGYTGSIVGAPPVPVASASAAEAGGLLQMLTSWVIHWP
ncbi:unnamed protein product, partial [Polarella glacialis]